MKIKNIGLIMIGILFCSNFILAANENPVMHVSADILESTIGITIPNSIEIGSIASGYLSNRTDLDIKNIGTVDVVVSPEVVFDEANTGAYEIFTNLAFKNILSDTLKTIGEYSLTISKPSEVGGTRTERVYMYLDLINYSGNVQSFQEADVIFWVTTP